MAYSPGRSPREHSMSIPIPPHYAGSVSSAERSPRPLPSPSGSSRSPSQTNLSSYRTHPYPRRPSLSSGAHSMNDDRILLPPPNSGAPLHVLHEGRHRSGSGSANGIDRDGDRNNHGRRPSYDGRDARDRNGGNGHGRPSLNRAQSDGRFTERSMQLPSFASLSASTSSSPSTYPGGPLTPTSNGAGPPAGTPMGPPGMPGQPPSPGSHAGSPKLFGMAGLRPSYSYDANPAPRTTLGLSGASNGYHRGEHSPPYDRNERDQRDRDRAPPPQSDRSPPLRSIHQVAGYPPDAYYGHAAAAAAGRARSHSAASALGRYPHQHPNGGPRSSSSEDGWVQSPPTPRDGPAPYPAPPSGGQSRRLAHLMSEQKRRESINTGFQALRTALPSSIPTDSKAIILRKAVSHITHLEGLLRKAGLPITTKDGTPLDGAPGANAAESDRDATPSAQDDEDVVMREATGAVRGLSVKMDKAGWQDVQVEDVEVDRKPTLAA